MFNFCSLYSGSTGNSLFVQTDNTNILIDAGVSVKKITSALEGINSNINNIDAILITHEHSDHIKSVGVLSNKFNIPVYASEKTWNFLPTDIINKNNQCIFNIYNKFNVGDLEIIPFSTPHDAIDPCGFNIYYNKNKISIATDLGHVNDDIFEHLSNSSFVLLESNYDPEILKCCSYPYYLKNRIIGPTGHLSNSTAGKTICKLIDFGLKSVMLGHLSKENNFPELAYQTVLEELNNDNKESIDISIANRGIPSKLIAIPN